MKTDILYRLPLDQAVFIAQSINISVLPLGEFFEYYPLDENAFRKCLINLLKSTRTNPRKVTFDDFKNVFDSSLKDDIEFELSMYYEYLFKK